MKLIWCALPVLAACEFPTRSERYECVTNTDCESGRSCKDGYCVLGADSDSGMETAIDGAVDVAPDADLIKMQCEAAGYTFEAGPAGYYKSVANAASWTNAQTACKDVADSSHLIVLSTTAEVTYMATQLGWVGLSDRATENQFVTVTEEVGDQRPWASGQPDDGGGEDCTQMKAGGQLDDDQCGNSHRYVCECDGKTSTP